MTVAEFNEWVWYYGSFGTKGMESFDEKTKDAIIEAWAAVANDLDDLTDAEADEIINAYHKDTLYTVTFNCKDSEGYYTGVGGTVGYDEELTDTYENSMFFETKEEAESWIEKNKDSWGYGDFSIN